MCQSEVIQVSSDFWKFRPIHFYERPILVSVLEILRGFLLLWRREKSKKSIRCLQWAVLEAAYSCTEISPAQFLPSALSLCPGSVPLNLVCEHLCFISIYSVHQLQRCVPGNCFFVYAIRCSTFWIAVVGFSTGYLLMWELNYKESWALKNWGFWTLVLERTLESPLDCKAIHPVHPKDQSWIFIGRTDAEAETPILGPRCEELTL